MVQISKEEAAILRKAMPRIHIKRTVNHYYVEDRPELARILKRGVERDC